MCKKKTLPRWILILGYYEKQTKKTGKNNYDTNPHTRNRTRRSASKNPHLIYHTSLQLWFNAVGHEAFKKERWPT